MRDHSPTHDRGPLAATRREELAEGREEVLRLQVLEGRGVRALHDVGEAAGVREVLRGRVADALHRAGVLHERRDHGNEDDELSPEVVALREKNFGSEEKISQEAVDMYIEELTALIIDLKNNSYNRDNSNAVRKEIRRFQRFSCKSND